MDLFEHARQEEMEQEAPLAARMRPRTLEEFVGQEHVVGPGRLLHRAIQADQISSVIFTGPPGTGKTTLARIIANTTDSRFATLNAVLDGVKNVREVVAEAKNERALYGRRTILFVDEVHRWNKAQQDALLPWVENGTVIMIGATTENPWFSVNKALLSRSRVFQLESLRERDLRVIGRRALEDGERGYGDLDVVIDDEAFEHLVHVASGDARSLLNALELAIETTRPDDRGRIVIDLAVAEESIQQRAVLYDREGDYHFDTISAFIKSIRGSDPDAALYWLAKMVHAGEHPEYIWRRLLILASEDVGLADPHALPLVEAAAAAFERVGLPEGQFHLAEATLYLATTEKSNSAMAYFDALETVRNERDDGVPTHLKDASRDKEGFGHGEGYAYPHAYRDHWVAQQYLPNSLQGRVFYQPSGQGYEREIAAQVARRREQQIAAMVEGQVSSGDVLTFTPLDRDRERWLLRTIGNAAQGLGEMRDRLFAQVDLERHHLVLDLNAGTGLLTWEALRRVPEGGVWSLVGNPEVAEALREQAQALPELERPRVLEGELGRIRELLEAGGDGAVRFDVVLGRNALMAEADKASLLRGLGGLMRPGATLCLAETVPRRGQRLSALMDLEKLDGDVAARVRSVEEGIYGNPRDPMVNWGADSLREALQAAGFDDVHVHSETLSEGRLITRQQVLRWFEPSDGGRPSYADRLATELDEGEIGRVKGRLLTDVADQTCAWRRVVAYVVGRWGDDEVG